MQRFFFVSLFFIFKYTYKQNYEIHTHTRAHTYHVFGVKIYLHMYELLSRCTRGAAFYFHRWIDFELVYSRFVCVFLATQKKRPTLFTTRRFLLPHDSSAKCLVTILWKRVIIVDWIKRETFSALIFWRRNQPHVSASYPHSGVM